METLNQEGRFASLGTVPSDPNKSLRWTLDPPSVLKSSTSACFRFGHFFFWTHSEQEIQASLGQICTCTCLLSALLTGYRSTVASTALRADGRQQLMLPRCKPGRKRMSAAPARLSGLFYSALIYSADRLCARFWITGGGVVCTE